MNKCKECEDAFNMGANIALTIDKCLSFVEIEKKYLIHRSTILSWSKHNMYDFEHGYKRLLYEYLRKYNKDNSKAFMEKYRLPANNTSAHISEALLIDLETMDKMRSSKKQWSANLLDILSGLNTKLFDMQIKLIKQMNQANKTNNDEKDFKDDNI